MCLCTGGWRSSECHRKNQPASEVTWSPLSSPVQKGGHWGSLGHTHCSTAPQFLVRGACVVICLDTMIRFRICLGGPGLWGLSKCHREGPHRSMVKCATGAYSAFTPMVLWAALLGEPPNSSQERGGRREEPSIQEDEDRAAQAPCAKVERTQPRAGARNRNKRTTQRCPSPPTHEGHGLLSVLGSRLPAQPVRNHSKVARQPRGATILDLWCPFGNSNEWPTLDRQWPFKKIVTREH